MKCPLQEPTDVSGSGDVVIQAPTATIEWSAGFYEEPEDREMIRDTLEIAFAKIFGERVTVSFGDELPGDES